MQVKSLKSPNFSYSHSIVRNYLQFVPICRSLLQIVLFTPSLKNCRESMGSNLGHGFSGHPRRFRGSRKPFLVLNHDRKTSAVNHELLRCRVVLLVEVNRGLLVLLVIGAPPEECSSRWDSCEAWNRGDFGRRNPFIQRVSANRAI